MQILLLDQGICRKFVLKRGFDLLIWKGICASGGWFAPHPGGNSKIPVWGWEEAEVGTGVFIPSWDLGWEGVALIQTRSLAWLEGGKHSQ